MATQTATEAAKKWRRMGFPLAGGLVKNSPKVSTSDPGLGLTSGVVIYSKMRHNHRMTGKRSADTERALRLVSRGMTPYAAAKKVGIALSTIYRAIKREKEKAK
jgi:hypothetical protein